MKALCKYIVQASGRLCQYRIYCMLQMQITSMQDLLHAADAAVTMQYLLHAPDVAMSMQDLLHATDVVMSMQDLLHTADAV